MYNIIQFTASGTFESVKQFKKDFVSPVGLVANAGRKTPVDHHKQPRACRSPPYSITKSTKFPIVLQACDIPPRTDFTVFVDIGRDERENYNTEVAKCDEKSILAAARLTKLRPTWSTGMKLRVVSKIIHGCLQLDQKVVIFSNNYESMAAIEELCDINSYVRFDGHSSLPKRKQSIRDFHIDPAITCMIASTKTASEAINLTAGSRLIMFDAEWTPATEGKYYA